MPPSASWNTGSSSSRTTGRRTPRGHPCRPDRPPTGRSCHGGVGLVAGAAAVVCVHRVRARAGRAHVVARAPGRRDHPRHPLRPARGRGARGVLRGGRRGHPARPLTAAVREASALAIAWRVAGHAPPSVRGRPDPRPWRRRRPRARPCRRWWRRTSAPTTSSWPRTFDPALARLRCLVAAPFFAAAERSALVRVAMGTPLCRVLNRLLDLFPAARRPTGQSRHDRGRRRNSERMRP